MEVICPNCLSTNVRYRSNRNNWICDDCDYIFTRLSAGAENRNQLKTESKRIFLSYGHDCTNIVLRVKKDLEALGYKVWIDVSEIKSGYDWRQYITEGILNSQAILVFLSRHGLRPGGVCLDEIAIAVGCNRNIIRTCLLENEAIEYIPSTINGIEYVDMTAFRDKEGEEFEAWYKDKFLEIRGNIESVLMVRQDPMLKELEKRLQPWLQFTNQLYELRKHYTPRPWLNDIVNRWLEASKKQFLLITAYPGGGKSSFCVNYFHFHPMVISMTICDNHLKGDNQLLQLLRDISYQITTNHIPYRRNLMWVLNNRSYDLNKMTFGDLFELLLCAPFLLEIDGNHSPLLIVVDGLDKINVKESGNFFDVFNEYSERLPSYIHFLFTARHSGDLINNFARAYHVDIDPGSQETFSDIKRYLKSELKELTSRQLNEIAKQCCGSFLYASLLVEAIRHGYVDVKEAMSLQQEQRILYYQSMRQLFPDNHEYEQFIRPISLILGANGELPVHLLMKYMGWHHREMNVFYKRCMMFFQRVADNRGIHWIKIVYPSFIEWITNESDYTNEYYIPLHKARCILADAMWDSYMSKSGLDDYELTNIFSYLKVVGKEKQLNTLMADESIMFGMIDRINCLLNESNEYHTVNRLLALCKDIIASTTTEAAYRVRTGIIPYLEINIAFVAGEYQKVINIYNEFYDGIKQFCNENALLNIKFMLATSYDISGDREISMKLFESLLSESISIKNKRYELYAIIGLLWNAHSNNILEGYKYIERLENMEIKSQELIIMQRLILARFKLSEGRLRESLSDFEYVIAQGDSFIWGYDIISTRNQMLLIEALVAYYDNREYQRGISIGMQIYANIGNNIDVASCYCASWIAMNMIQAGKLEDAEKLLKEAEQKNEILQRIGKSRWMQMHLLSVRAFWLAYSGKWDEAVSAHEKVIAMSEEMNDAWVKGDACFEIFCLLIMAKEFESYKSKTHGLYLILKEVAEKSQLKHLKYKMLVVECFLFHDIERVKLLLSETKKLVITDMLASTNLLIVLFLCYIQCKRFQMDEEMNQLYLELQKRFANSSLKNPEMSNISIYKEMMKTMSLSC